MARHFSVVGPGRCGSTWIRTVLNAHPRIALTNEAGALPFLHFCGKLAEQPRFSEARLAPIDSYPIAGIVDDSVRDRFVDLFRRHALEMAETLYAELFPEHGRDPLAWCGDKLLDPRVARDLQIWLPDARFLVLARDPRDVLCSWRAHGRKRSDLGDYGRRLAESQALPHAQVWRSIFEMHAPQLKLGLNVRCEDVVADPRTEIGRILRFLDLEWDDALDNAMPNPDLLQTHGTSSSALASIGRWRRELDDEDIATIERICERPMRELGYELVTRPTKRSAQGALEDAAEPGTAQADDQRAASGCGHS